MSKNNYQRRSIKPTFFERYLRWFPLVIFLLGLGTFVLGYIGFHLQYYYGDEAETGADDTPIQKHWTYVLLKTVQLFLLNSGGEDDQQHTNNTWLIAARVLAVVLFMVLSVTIVLRLGGELRRFWTFLKLKNQVVICGLGRVGLEILDDLVNQPKPKKILIIEADEKNPWLKYARQAKAIVITGDATRHDVLSQAKLAKAESVLIATGKDAINLEITAEIEKLMTTIPKRPKPLQLRTHIIDMNLALSLQTFDRAPGDSALCEKQVFNVAYASASDVISMGLWDYAPKTKDEVAHFVIVGFGPMGQAIATRIAQLAHFPNFKKSRLTIADENIQQLANDYLVRFPRFCPWSDTRLGVAEFNDENDRWSNTKKQLPDGIHVDGTDVQYVCNAQFVDLSSALVGEKFVSEIEAQLKAPGVKPMVFVCGTDDHSSYETAMRLADLLTCRDLSQVPVFVWLPKQPALFENLKKHALGGANQNRLIPFGDCQTIASYENIVTPARERLGFEFFSFYKSLYSTEKAKYEEAWRKEQELMRESNRQVADHLHIKLAILGYRINAYDLSKPFVVDELKVGNEPLLLHGKPIDEEQIRMISEIEHNRFLAERLMSGWRYDSSKKPAQRLNPTLISWQSMLNMNNEKEKDRNQIIEMINLCRLGLIEIEALPTKSS